jgi:hypothetical protein
MLHSHTAKKGRAWAITDETRLIKQVSKTPKQNFGLFEIILTNNRRKVFFDIDGNINTDLEKVKAEILRVFPDGELQISGYETDVKKSYHIIVSNYHFDNGHKQASVMKQWANNNKHLGFDDKVYVGNRLMKCINSCKPDKPVQKYISGSTDVKKHIITAYFDENSIDALTRLKPLEKEIFHPKNTKKIDVATVKQLDFKVPKNIGNLLNLTPFELISLIPNKPRDDPNAICHEITWSVALFLHVRGIKFEKFWSWAKQKDSSVTRMNRWLNFHWNGSVAEASKNYPFVDTMTIIKILERFYPNINKDRSNSMFRKLQNITYTKSIDKKYISYDDFSDKKYQLLAIGMGSGKTTTTIRYLKKTGTNFCFITPRITLNENLKRNFAEENLEYSYYKDLKGREQKEKYMKFKKNLVICCPSLHYLNDAKYETVVIDEIETLLSIWMPNITNEGEKLQKNWNVFKYILQNAKKVILIDAFMSQTAINFIKELDPTQEIEIIGKTMKPEQRYVTYFYPNTRKLEKISQAFERWYQSAVSQLRDGKKIYIFFPYKREADTHCSMDQFKNKLIKDSGIDENLFISYTADSPDKQKKQLKKVNEVWGSKKCVITNQTITVGVNYDNDDFDAIYIAYDSFVKPRDAIQTSYRIRKIKSNRLYLVQIGSGGKQYDFKVYNFGDPIYNNLITNLITEEKTKNMTILKMYLARAGYQIDDKVKISNFDEKVLSDFYGEMHGTNCIYRYDQIKDVDDIDEYKTRIEQNCASTDDKLIYMKHRFKTLFKAGTPETIIQKYWMSDRQQVYNYYIYINSKSNIIKDILTELKLDNINLPKKFKISEELRKKIFDNFKFTRISKDVSPMKLVGKALNTYMCMNTKTKFCFGWFGTDKKNGYWTHSEYFTRFQDEVMEYLDILPTQSVIDSTKYLFQE